jgi:hypothetical protein
MITAWRERWQHAATAFAGSRKSVSIDIPHEPPSLDLAAVLSRTSADSSLG